MIFRFEISSSTAADYSFLASQPEFFEMSPREMTRALIAQAAKRCRQEAIAAAPKQPAHKETAEERKKRESAERREAKLNEYRQTGDWPRVMRYRQTEGSGSAWRDGQVITWKGAISFTVPGDPTRSICGWEPPEDYPYMDEYLKALEEVAQEDVVVDDYSDEPQRGDYESDDAFASAMTAYWREMRERG